MNVVILNVAMKSGAQLILKISQDAAAKIMSLVGCDNPTVCKGATEDGVQYCVLMRDVSFINTIPPHLAQPPGPMTPYGRGSGLN